MTGRISSSLPFFIEIGSPHQPSPESIPGKTLNIPVQTEKKKNTNDKINHELFIEVVPTGLDILSTWKWMRFHTRTVSIYASLIYGYEGHATTNSGMDLTDKK